MELAEEVGGEAVGVAVVADQQSPWEGHCVTAVFLQILWGEKKNVNLKSDDDTR